MELDKYAALFFVDPISYSEVGVKKYFKGEDTIKILNDLVVKLETLMDFDIAFIEKTMQAVIDDLKISNKQIIHPTRLAVTGSVVGPGLFELMEILGRDVCVNRIKKAVDRLFEPQIKIGY